MSRLDEILRGGGAGRALSADDWKSAEQAAFAEVRRSPRAAARVVAAFERAADRCGTAVARGRAARLRGSWLAYRGRRAESVPHYRRAISLLDGSARDGARIGLASELMRLRRGAAARALFAAARRDARRRNDRLLEAGASFNEASALHERGDAARALPFYREARTAFAAAGNAALAAAARMNAARALTDLTRPAEAAAEYDAAVAEMDAAGLSHDAARARHNRALLLSATDRLGDADRDLRDAEDRYRRAGDEFHAALARRDRGEALLRAGMLPEARALLGSALRSLRRADAPDDAARAALLAARAADSAASAVRILRSVRLRRGDAAEREEILAIHRGDAAALERLASRIGASRARARAGASARLLAHAARAGAGAAETAPRTLGLARRAADEARRASSASTEFMAHAAAFAASTLLARHAVAEHALAASIDALDRVREGLATESMRSALLSGREGWLAAGVRHRLDAQGDVRGALALLERWRARTLLDVIADGPAAPADVSLVRKRIGALERAAAGAEPARLRGVPRAAARAFREETRLLDALDRRIRGGGARPPVLDLPPGTAAVSLLEAGGRTLAFVVAGGSVSCGGFSGGPRSIGAPSGDALRGGVAGAAARLRFTAGASAHGPEWLARRLGLLRADFDAALAEIAAHLREVLAGLLEREGLRRVVFVPDGAWHGVPFAALLQGGVPLGERFEVACAPSLASLSLPAHGPADGPALVLAPGEPGLPASLGEARAVAAALGAEPVLGSAATSDALLAARRPSCLHIAAHGRRRADLPAASGLRLADGWFRAAELARLDLAGSLVVLSGCETGVHGSSPGGEIHGLVRAAFAAGASDVVASLWRVEDAATAAFMGRFHELRRSGSTTGAAVAGARRSLQGPGIPPWHAAAFAHFSRRR